MHYGAMGSLSSEKSPDMPSIDDDKESPGVQLPSTFQPTPYCVICGRGKDCFNHVGNRRFRVIIDIYQERYSKADTKIAKGQVVTKVWETIQCAGGRFVKFQNGAWWEVTESIAREKIGSQFREVLHGKYKSSSKSKMERRRQRRRRIVDFNSIQLERSFGFTRPQGLLSFWPQTSPVESSHASSVPSTWSENSSVVSSNLSTYTSVENASVVSLPAPNASSPSDPVVMQAWEDRKPPPGWSSSL